MSKPREIALIGTFPPPFGGVAIHIRSLSEYLSGKGVQWVVYNTGKTKDISISGVVNVRSLRDLLAKLFWCKADIFHAHGGTDLYRKMSVLYVLRKIRRKKYMVTVHSGGIVKDLEKKGPIGRKTISTLFKGAESVVCVNVKIKDVLRELGVQENKLTVVPAFSIKVSLESVVLSEKLNRFLASHKPILSCLGYSFGPHYGFDLAIKAVNGLKKKEYPKIGLVIMGADKKEMDFQRLLAKFNDETLSCVLFTGDIDHKSVLSVIKTSDLFLRPTYHDGDSISVREAIAMNVPVVASDTEIRPEETILFSKGDREDLEIKIRQCLMKKRRETTAGQLIVHQQNLEAVFDIYNHIE